MIKSDSVNESLCEFSFELIDSTLNSCYLLIPLNVILPCGDISKLTYSSTSRNNSFRLYLIPSLRQPICPVTFEYKNELKLRLKLIC